MNTCAQFLPILFMAVYMAVIILVVACTLWLLARIAKATERIANNLENCCKPKDS